MSISEDVLKMRIELEKCFYDHDPMGLGVKENELFGEYDHEVSMVVENIGNVSDENDVEELLEFVFDEAFSMVPVFTNEFLLAVKKIILNK